METEPYQRCIITMDGHSKEVVIPLRRKRATKPPTQSIVDAVGAFVEIIDDLKSEPFLSLDERLGYSSGGNSPNTFNLGDRSHFRSALISFRRIWMNDEPTFYSKVGGFVLNHSQFGDEDFSKQISKTLRSPCTHIQDYSADNIIRLWINTVFAHAGLKPDKKINRNAFENLINAHGAGKTEYAFRWEVFMLCHQFVSFGNFSAKPALEEWKEEHNLEPSFKLSSPFGKSLREKAPDGSIIIRQASSKYYTEETSENRFKRILKRNMFSGLEFFLNQLEATSTGTMLLALRFHSILDILHSIEWKFSEMTKEESASIWQSNKKMCASSHALPRHDMFGDNQPIYFDRDYTFHTTSLGIDYLNQQLALFVKTFKED